MGEYFKPWRRKVGVVTLLLACMFAAGWVRSLSIEDSIYRVSGVGSPAIAYVQSTRGCILWWSNSKSYFPANSSGLVWSFSAAKINSFNINDDNNRSPWLLKQIGIGIGSRVDIGMGRDVWIVPYWPIVIPLSLISAFLLLSKSRRSNQKKIDKPIHSEGA